MGSRLERHTVLVASFFARANAGSSNAISRAMMDITTSSSMSVKPFGLRPIGCVTFINKVLRRKNT